MMFGVAKKEARRHKGGVERGRRKPGEAEPAARATLCQGNNTRRGSPVTMGGRRVVEDGVQVGAPQVESTPRRDGRR